MNLWGKIIPVFLAFALLMGCAAPKTPSHPQTIQPATATVPVAIPTLTPNPSETPIPGPTAEAALKTSGPYLVYVRGINADHPQLILMDADGMGRKVIAPPSANPLFVYFVSPDGKWLAYYAGSADKEKASDLELDLLNLETGQAQLVAKLLSKDYPNNFDEAEKELKTADPTTYITADELKQAFNEGIAHSIGWSPDGKYLAFAGQMDGLSSDIYLYDLAKGSFRRISKGPQEIQDIDWSPDGKWILSSSTMQFGEGVVFDEDAIAFGSFKLKSLYSQTEGGGGWYNDHAYIVYDNENGIGKHNLRSVDIETGKVRKIWGGVSFESFVLDPEQELLIIFAEVQGELSEANTNFKPGMHLINIKTGKEISLDQSKVSLNTSFFGLGNHRFLSNDGNKAYFINADGTFTPADPTLNYPSVAPDKQHWIGIGKTLKVFNADDSLAFDMPLPFTPPSPPSNFYTMWSPDSSMLFIISSTEIYSVDIQHQEIHLVEENFFPNQGLTFTSIPAK